MNIPILINQILAPPAVGGSIPDPFTNALGQQVVGMWGDSYASGNSTAPGPDATGVGWYQNYNTNTLVPITTNDVMGVVNGSMCPQYCISKFAATGKKTIMALAGFSGSKIYDATGSNSWDTGGALYAIAKARTAAAMAANGVTKPVAIIVTSFGGNDIAGASNIANVAIAIDSFFARITADYPDTKIIVTIPGRLTIDSMNFRFATVREGLYRAVRTYSNIVLGPYFAQYIGRGLYGPDNLHLSYDGNNQSASDIVIAELNSTYNKFAQAVMLMRPNTTDDTKKNAINTFFVNQSANIALCDTLQIWISEGEQDALTDWVCRSCTKINNGATWGVKTGLQTNGTSTFARPEFIPSLQCIYGTVNDVFTKIFMGTNLTPAGTQGTAIGSINSTARVNISQSVSSNIAYQINDNGGQTFITDTRLLDNTIYTGSRNSSTTKRIYKNGSSPGNVTQSVTVFAPRELYVGCVNSTGTAASFINSSFKAVVVGKEAGFDHASFDAALVTLITALEA